MPVSKAQQRATNKYISKAYDRINLTVPKGRKETIKAHAAAQNESVNGFINRAISEAMERDASESRLKATESTQGGGGGTTLGTANKAKERKEKAWYPWFWSCLSTVNQLLGRASGTKGIGPTGGSGHRLCLWFCMAAALWRAGSSGPWRPWRHPLCRKYLFARRRVRGKR